MIVEYHRPETLEAALALLARPVPVTVPLGGGTVLNRPGRPAEAAVDLQALGLNTFAARGNFYELGATLTLQTLLEQDNLPPALRLAITREASLNLRQAGTVAGTLVAADGRSPFATAMLALDAALTLQPGAEKISLGDLLALRKERLAGKLITLVTIPANVRLALESVARTPADRPLVCVAVAGWHSGRTRVAVGGFGPAPRLILDGTEAEGAESAIRSALEGAGDEWASAAYRQDAAATLVGRCLDEMKNL